MCQQKLLVFFLSASLFLFLFYFPAQLFCCVEVMKARLMKNARLLSFFLSICLFVLKAWTNNVRKPTATLDVDLKANALTEGEKCFSKKTFSTSDRIILNFTFLKLLWVGVNCSKCDCSTVICSTLLAANQLLDTNFINCSNPVNPG